MCVALFENLLLYKTAHITIHKKWLCCKLFCDKNCNLGKHVFWKNDNKFCNNVKGKPKRKLVCCTIWELAFAQDSTHYNTQKMGVLQIVLLHKLQFRQTYFLKNDNKFCNNVNENWNEKKPKRKVYRVALLRKLVFAKYSTLYNNTQKNSIGKFYCCNLRPMYAKTTHFWFVFFVKQNSCGRHRKAVLKNAVVCKFQT